MSGTMTLKGKGVTMVVPTEVGLKLLATHSFREVKMTNNQRIQQRVEQIATESERLGHFNSGLIFELKPSRDVIEDIDMHNLVWRQEAVE